MYDLYETRNSIYCYGGTETLVNNLQIKDPKKLFDYENRIVVVKLFALRHRNELGMFDINHFIDLHKYLFEDIYPFAGKLRAENIAKDSFRFAEWQFIDKELNRILEELKNENYLLNLNKEQLAKRLSYYMSELNVLHPFREGNGRTIREFIRQLAVKNGYELNLSKINSYEMLEASIKSVVDDSDLEKIIYKCLQKM